MAAFVEMHPRVPMRRGVTATDVPAGQGTDASALTSSLFSGNPRSLPHSALHRESFSDAGQPSRPHPFHSDARRMDRPAIGRALSYVDAPFDKDFYERWCNTVGCGHVGMDGPAQRSLAVLFGDKCPKALKYRHAGSKCSALLTSKNHERD
jgi:hypothetical protein